MYNDGFTSTIQSSKVYPFVVQKSAYLPLEKGACISLHILGGYARLASLNRCLAGCLIPWLLRFRVQPYNMADIEVPIAYAVAVVLMLSLFLNFFLEWRFHHNYSFTYLHDGVPLPLLYLAFVLSSIFLIEKQRSSLRPSTDTAHLTVLITGSLWVSLGLQVRCTNSAPDCQELLTVG